MQTLLQTLKLTKKVEFEIHLPVEQAAKHLSSQDEPRKFVSFGWSSRLGVSVTKISSEAYQFRMIAYQLNDYPLRSSFVEVVGTL